jgi:hypothetical protein
MEADRTVLTGDVEKTQANWISGRIWKVPNRDSVELAAMVERANLERIGGCMRRSAKEGAKENTLELTVTVPRIGVKKSEASGEQEQVTALKLRALAWLEQENSPKVNVHDATGASSGSRPSRDTVMLEERWARENRRGCTSSMVGVCL